MQRPSSRRGLAALLAALTLLVSAAAATWAAPLVRSMTLAGVNGAIAFIRDGNLWIMRSDGSNQTLLIDDVSGLSDPDWAPDGSRIAFIKGSDVWIFTLGLQGYVNVTASAELETDPAWSPDGGSIAFGRWDGSQWDMYVSRASAGPQTAVNLTPGNPRFDGMPAWSPDGTQIAYMSDRLPGSAAGVHVMPYPEGGPGVQLATTTTVGPHPDWSPDGTTISYLNFAELYTVSAAGGRGASLTPGQEAIFGTSWSPDGTMIAFTAGDSNNEIMAWTPSGVVNLTNSPATDDRLPDWSSVEFVGGSESNDTITGTSADEVIHAGGGDDTIDGGGGDDTIFGGDGNDVITGDTSSRFQTTARELSAAGEYGDDTIDGGAGDDRIDVGLGADIVDGGDGADRIWGMGAQDRLVGGAGGDQLVGGADADVLSGGGGNDNLNGGPGVDRFDAGAGRDVCTVDSRREKRRAKGCERITLRHSR